LSTIFNCRCNEKKCFRKKTWILDETQGTLFFDIARIINEKRPKAFLLENVKNLLSHDKGKTFSIISEKLKKLNYSIHCDVLDGKHFVPQHRERILIVGFDKDVFQGKENFKFPELPEPSRKFSEILESNVESKYTLTNKLWNYLQD
jgi:DNA (cytosine-5)-methyltransferase 1